MKTATVGFRWLIFSFILAVLIGGLPDRSTAKTGSEKWAQILCEELGCISIAYGTIMGGVDLHAIGLVTNKAPLKNLGFEFGNDAYKMTAVRIDTGRYLITVQSMSRQQDQQKKQVTLKTKADDVFPITLAVAPEGKYTWNSAIQYDMEDQVGIRPHYVLEEKPLDFVDIRITDPDKLDSFGLPGKEKGDTEYQLLYLGNNRWEFHSIGGMGHGILVYQNARWTREDGMPAADSAPVASVAVGPSKPTHPSPTAARSSGAVSTAKPVDPTLLFLNSDFELGDLTNWVASGEAFAAQPTKGDNPTARYRGQPSNHQGNFWIGTYEKYQGAEGQVPGQIQGDGPTGTLTSIPFEITGDRISFLIGGGRHPDSVYVALVVNGEEVYRETGNNHESMKRHIWDVAPYRGKEAVIVISDQSSGGWGHINADDFRYESEN